MLKHPLKQYREDHGLTLQSVAERANASAATLSRIEARKLKPSMDLCARLKAVTGLSADNFLPVDELMNDARLTS